MLLLSVMRLLLKRLVLSALEEFISPPLLVPVVLLVILLRLEIVELRSERAL